MTLLEETLCLKFCAYYKPGKNEELACRGYIVAERLLHAGKAIAFQKSGRKLDLAAIETLVQKMCMACDFHEHDCNFMLDRASPPCGGFVLLAQLIESGEISIEDI